MMSPACPLCGCGDTRVEQTFQAAALRGAWQRLYGIDIEGELRGVASFDERRCLRCDLRFFPGELAGSSALYEALQRFDWYYMRDKWEHGEALSEVKAGDRLLEVGSGEGEFLRRARGQGVEAQGLELNPQASRRATELGLPVESCLMSALLPARRGAFDVVCSFQVLEHVPEPLAFLREACELLRPGGRLLLAVPDAEGWIRLQEGNLLDMPPHHVSRWSARSFQSLAWLLPLRLERVAREPLPSLHARAYLDVQAERLERASGVRVGEPWRRALARLIDLGVIRRRLAGQGLYASLLRLPGDVPRS